MRSIRIGIMSAAHVHADGFVHNLRAAPHVELVGIADDDAKRGQAFAHKCRLTWYPSYDALLKESPDGVIICTENVRHLDSIKLAASAGAHILCEKPLTTSVEDGRTAINVCERAGVHLMTAFPVRFSAPIREVKTLLDGGGLGRLHAMNGTNQGQCPQRYRAWFVEKALAGGGAMMDHIVHLADIMRWYTGSEAVEVYAQSNRILYSDTASEVETGGLVMITFADGTFASIDSSWSKPLAYPTWGGLALDLIGDKGVISVNAFKQGLTVFNETRKLPAFLGWASDSGQSMVNEFAAAIREGRQPAITGYDGLKATEIVVAAYRSAASGQPEQIAT
jgi:predicted dehydrogenase